MTDTLFADVSYFQNPVNDSYPYPVLSIRSNDGTFRDPNFAENYAWCVNAVESGKLECFIVYAYWRSTWDATAQTMIDMVTAAGGPHPRMVAMIDLESGGNPGGDQSDGINRMYWKLADWLGTPKRVIGYANASDFNSMWRTRPDGLRVIGAGYGRNPNLPGQIAHQYTDGQGYGGGLPEGASPFGNCDMNSADGLSAPDFATACGVGASPATNVIDAMAASPANAWIGSRVTVGENICPDGVGRWVEFENAHVYWTADTGAHAIPHAGLFESFRDHGFEAGALGYPVLDFTRTDEGGIQAFQGGVLYVKNGSAAGYYVHGTIAGKWSALGWEKSPYGWPTADEVDYDDGRMQTFDNGTLYWSPSSVIGIAK